LYGIFYGIFVDFVLLTLQDWMNLYVKPLDFSIHVIYIIENNPERRFVMGKNTNGTKELPNEKNHAPQEIRKVEESQPSQESPSEGLASVENDKDKLSPSPEGLKRLRKYIRSTGSFASCVGSHQI
jgi:hypothetical protein